MSTRIRVGVRPPHDLFQHGMGALRGFVQRAAEVGIDHVWVGDHISFKGGQGYDGLVHSAVLAALAPSLEIRTSVYLLALRHPVATARQVSTLAELAPGRFCLGVGLGGEDPHELELVGVDPRTRGRRLDEHLLVLRRLLGGETVDFTGTFVEIHEAVIAPVPDPPVPLVVGGRSEAALRRAGSLGDGWLGVWVTPSRWADSVATVDAIAAELGRPLPEHHGFLAWCGIDDRADAARQRLAKAMERSYKTPFERFERSSPAGTAEHVADALAPYVQAGCTSFDLLPITADPEVALDGVARVRELLNRA